MEARSLRRRGRSALPAAALLALAASGCGGEKGPLESNRRPVVLISIDSLRADHCSAYGYQPPFAPEERTTPLLERLAAEGVLFRNASSSTSWTLPAHVSLLTGMHCQEHGVRNRAHRLSPAVETLAGRFRRAGYATAGFYSGPFLHASWGFSHGFDTYRPASPYLEDLEAVAGAITSRQPGSLHGLHQASHEDARCSERVVDAALAWLEEDRRHERPFFLFLHLWDPHYDYQPPQEYADRFQPGYQGPVTGRDFMDPGRRWNTEELARFQSLYDAEIRYTDDQVARLFRRLEAWGLADRLILAIASDHGDEFYEHGRKGHQKSLYEEVMRVPMVIRAPGPGGVPAGAVVEGSAALYDLAPTLLDLAGVAPWDRRSGRSLRPLWEQAAPGHEVVMDLEMPGPNGERWSGWRRDQRKVVMDRRRNTVAAFDLGADPGERTPEWLQSGAAHPIGRAAEAAWEAAAACSGHALPMQEPEALSKVLAEVGYAQDAEPPESRSEGRD